MFSSQETFHEAGVPQGSMLAGRAGAGGGERERGEAGAWMVGGKMKAISGSLFSWNEAEARRALMSPLPYSVARHSRSSLCPPLHWIPVEILEFWDLDIP
jgi:hypothetical protein